MREPVHPDILVGRVMDALEGIRDEASLTWIVTDSGGIVLEASADAPQTLGITAPHLRGRGLLASFDGERTEWAAGLVRAQAGERVERTGRLRPRERRPLVVIATIMRAVDYPIAGAVLWTFRAASGLA